MRRFQAFSLALTFTITCLILSTILNSPTSNRTVTKQIYHNVVGSPYFDQTAKLEEQVDRDMEISLARLNFLSMQTEGFTDQSDFQTSFATRRKVSLFLACFEMSEPPTQQTVAFDTGSSLEGISFGGKMLDIDNEQLKISNHKGGAAFDSGASSSALQPMAQWKLQKEIVDLVGDSLERADYHGTYVTKLCFRGNLYTDFIGVPTVPFHFANDSTVELDYENIFQQYSGKVCFNVVDASQLGYKFNFIAINLQ